MHLVINARYMNSVKHAQTFIKLHLTDCEAIVLLVWPLSSCQSQCGRVMWSFSCNFHHLYLPRMKYRRLQVGWNELLLLLLLLLLMTKATIITKLKQQQQTINSKMYSKINCNNRITVVTACWANSSLELFSFRSQSGFFLNQKVKPNNVSGYFRV